MSLILSYECNAVCHKNCLTIHSAQGVGVRSPQNVQESAVITFSIFILASCKYSVVLVSIANSNELEEVITMVFNHFPPNPLTETIVTVVKAMTMRLFAAKSQG